MTDCYRMRFPPVCSRSPSLPPSLPPFSSCSGCFSALNFNGFPLINEKRFRRTYGNSQSTGTLAAPSASTVLLPVVLAVHTGPGPSPKKWPNDVIGGHSGRYLVPGIPQLQSDWSLSCDHGLDYAS